MSDQFECPKCKQSLPFGKLTDVCPKCATVFGFSSPFQPIPAQEQPANLGATHPDVHIAELSMQPGVSGESNLIKAFRIVVGALLFVFATLLCGLATEGLGFFIPGALALLGLYLSSARLTLARSVVVVLGILMIASIYLFFSRIGPIAFSR